VGRYERYVDGEKRFKVDAGADDTGIDCVAFSGITGVSESPVRL
jgi:hypothetical protein